MWLELWPRRKGTRLGRPGGKRSSMTLCCRNVQSLMIVEVGPFCRKGFSIGRKADRRGSHIRSTLRRGRPFDRDSSLVAAWPRSPARQAEPTEICNCTRRWTRFMCARHTGRSLIYLCRGLICLCPPNGDCSASSRAAIALTDLEILGGRGWTERSEGSPGVSS